MDRDWLMMLDEERIRFVILDLDGDGDLVQAFRARPGWTVDFEDGEAVIFTRATGNEPLN